MPARFTPLIFLGLVVWTPRPAEAQANHAPPLEQAMGYYLRGSWAWQQANADYEPGSDQPQFWIREYRWGPGRNLLIFDVYAVRERDQCESMLHAVLRWEEDTHAVVGQAYAIGGRGATVRLTGDSAAVITTVVEGTLPDGSPLRMRDRTDHSNPDYETVAAEMWRNGEWMPLDTARWELAPARVCS